MTLAINVMDGLVIEVEYNFSGDQINSWNIVSVEGNDDPDVIQTTWAILADTPRQYEVIHNAIYAYEQDEADVNKYNSGEDA